MTVFDALVGQKQFIDGFSIVQIIVRKDCNNTEISQNIAAISSKGFYYIFFYRKVFIIFSIFSILYDMGSNIEQYKALV